MAASRATKLALVMFRRISQLCIGLALYGFAGAMMVRAELGVDPWTVFAQGLVRVTGLSLGLVTILVGAAVLLLWIPLKQRPGIGTILNIFVVGLMLDVGLMFLGTPTELWQRILLFVGGLLLLAVATGLYIGGNFGTGPRDGLMVGLNSRFGIPIWIARTSIEITVLVTGWILGGNVGFGTLAFALLIGPLCGYTLPWFNVATAATPKLEAEPENH